MADADTIEADLAIQRDLFVDASKRWPNLVSVLVTGPEPGPVPVDILPSDLAGQTAVPVPAPPGQLHYVATFIGQTSLDTPAQRYVDGYAGLLVVRRRFGKFAGPDDEINNPDEETACGERFKTLSKRSARLLDDDRLRLSPNTLAWRASTRWQLAVHELTHPERRSIAGIYSASIVDDLFAASADLCNRLIAQLAESEKRRAAEAERLLLQTPVEADADESGRSPVLKRPCDAIPEWPLCPFDDASKAHGYDHWDRDGGPPRRRYIPSRQNVASFVRWQVALKPQEGFNPWGPKWREWKSVLSQQIGLTAGQIRDLDIPDIVAHLDLAEIDNEIPGVVRMLYQDANMLAAIEQSNMEPAEKDYNRKLIANTVSDLLLKSHGLDHRPLNVLGQSYPRGISLMKFYDRLALIVSVDRAATDGPTIIRALATLLDHAVADDDARSPELPKAELARRITGRNDARERDIDWARFDLKHIAGYRYTVSVTNMEPNMRDRVMNGL